MSDELECAACGAALGLGVPGSERWCRPCGGYVTTHVAESDWNAAAGAAVALGAGILVGLNAKRVLDHIFEE